MKKNTKLAYAILVIAFVLFCVIALAVPTAKTASFCTAFVFSVIAFAAQIVIWKTAFSKAEMPRSKFLGLPIVNIGFGYLIVQLIAFAVFMAIPPLAIWIPLVVCVLILGASTICLIAAEVGQEEVVRIEKTARVKVSFIRELQAEIEQLANAERDVETKKALTDFAEKIRYSDPMSNDELSSLEETMLNKVAVLKTAEIKLPIIDELGTLLTERNMKCKIGKK